MNVPGLSVHLPYRPNAGQIKRWRSLLCRLGPEWRILKGWNQRTLQALVRAGLLEFEPGWSFDFARLTIKGRAVRDRWIELEAKRLDKSLRSLPNRVGVRRSW